MVPSNKIQLLTSLTVLIDNLIIGMKMSLQNVMHKSDNIKEYKESLCINTVAEVLSCGI
jgi:hypothetical protein